MTTNYQTIEPGLSGNPRLRGIYISLSNLLAITRRRYIRLEIGFWMFAIPLLQESPTLHRVLTISYPMLKYIRWFFRLPQPLIWVLTGLSLGFLLGFLGGLILP